MAQPGWYPDPGGQPGRFRYWDGAAWTNHLSPDPGLAPGAGQRPGPPGTPGTSRQGQPPQPPPGPWPASAGGAGSNRRRSNPALVWLIVAGVVVLALAAGFAFPQLFGGPATPTPRGPAPTPTVSAWDENDSPSPRPSPTPTRPPETHLPCPRYDKAVVAGRLYGGGLSVPVIADSRWTVNAVRSIGWAVCATGLQRTIAPSWVSEVILAGIQPRSLGGSLQEQADAIAEDSLDRFYRAGEGRMVPKVSKAVSIGGLDAWELRYEVRVNYLKNIPGDSVNVLVVQHSDGSRSALLSFATIGDTETQRQVDTARTQVKVEN